jgi:CRP/FNR family transcriptional regulator, nitrogen oxide reductase regulator
MTASCPASSFRSAQVKPMSAVSEHLKSGFLEGLATLEVNTILAAATLRHYRTSAVLINQGDPADYLFLLRTGYARLFYITQEGRKVLLRWLPSGEILGVAALLSLPSLYLVSTEMVKDSSVFMWHRKTIRNLVIQYPKLLDNALPFASDHLTWFLATHLALISKTASERLAQVLLSLSQGIGYKVSGGIRLDITNEQLANAANITPFTTSRLLSEWQRRGAILKNRGKIVLRAPDRLFLHLV